MARQAKREPITQILQAASNTHKPKVRRPHIAHEMRELYDENTNVPQDQQRYLITHEFTRRLMPRIKHRALGVERTAA